MARSTVVEAYDQLLAEGYIESRRGSGTRVAQGLRPQPRICGLNTSDNLAPTDAAPADAPAPARVDGRNDPPGLVNFQSGIPALEHFPAAEWGRLYRQVCDSLPASALRYSSPQGVEELQQAIAGWLLRMRGLRAEPGQIMITTGATQGLRLVARLLNRYPQIDGGNVAFASAMTRLKLVLFSLGVAGALVAAYLVFSPLAA